MKKIKIMISKIYLNYIMYYYNGFDTADSIA